MTIKLNKWAKLSILIVALLIFKLPLWIENIHKETLRNQFGNEYANAIVILHKELKTETVNLSGENSYAIFVVSALAHPNVLDEPYLESLGVDVKNVYCTLKANSKYETSIRFMHVNVRAELTNGSNMIFSRELSADNCR